jgi:hypothetical protein
MTNQLLTNRLYNNRCLLSWRHVARKISSDSLLCNLNIMNASKTRVEEKRRRVINCLGTFGRSKSTYLVYIWALSLTILAGGSAAKNFDFLGALMSSGREKAGFFSTTVFGGG